MNKSISLNRIVSTVMHSPRTSTGFVLYPKVDGYSGELEGDLTKAEKDPTYIKLKQAYFNSATNIRKIWITHKRIRVQYFGTPRAGKNQQKHILCKSYSGEFIKAVEGMLGFNEKQAKYLMEKNINKDAKAPDRYKVTGNCLGVLASPYTCNNIEEIYIDWSMFASEEVASYFPNMCNLRALDAFLNGRTQFKEEMSDKLIEFFKASALSGVKDIRSRFPRLRIVAMVSNLDAIIKDERDKIPDIGFNNLDEEKQLWYDMNSELIKQSNSIVMIGLMVSDLKKLNKNFTIKNNQYKYDDEVLNPLVTAHIKKIEDSLRTKEYGIKSDEEDDTLPTGAAGDLESFMIQLEERYGETGLKNVMLCSIDGVGKTDLKNIFGSLSAKRRNKYAKMIGLSL